MPQEKLIEVVRNVSNANNIRPCVADQNDTIV